MKKILADLNKVYFFEYICAKCMSNTFEKYSPKVENSASLSVVINFKMLSLVSVGSFLLEMFRRIRLLLIIWKIKVEIIILIKGEKSAFFLKNRQNMSNI